MRRTTQLTQQIGKKVERLRRVELDKRPAPEQQQLALEVPQKPKRAPTWVREKVKTTA